MGRRANKPYLHGAMNVVSSLVLCLAIGRLVYVLRPSQDRSFSGRDHRVPKWLPTPPRQDDRHPRQADSVTTDDVLRGVVIPLHEQQQHLRQRRAEEGSRVGKQAMVVESGYRSHRWAGLGGGDDAWGVGMRVLIFTMDSLQDRVALASKGGPAGEIKIRESLSAALSEAGVQVEVATSDRDFERRAGAMDIYSAYVLDPWTWAGKGWRLKAQLKGRQHKMFILDFFGSDKPHANLGVPPIQHLTAFPVPASQSRTFLGYSAESRGTPSSGAEKKRQGVIWGKTAASFEGNAANVISRLADYVELHSTIAPQDAPLRHKNIVYHGMLPSEKWQGLLQESKFMIGLGDPLSGPSAVDAVMAGCVYLNPVYATPMKKVYNSQHPFLAESVGEPYVCSFGQKDAAAALDCARKALDENLPPMLPQELTHEAHFKRVREIFEPMVTSI